ncbi:hypothetical protein E3N88_16037 [Mikania micrantha]|uniref:Uncharacterized protein n=1 Tax=Mikania micrantha TaxID=192012 RepID=A0A5N6NYI5_9ASTR|nr:hypothetical protein E3N88_16037 [Mikania micrantha]
MEELLAPANPSPPAVCGGFLRRTSFSDELSKLLTLTLTLTLLFCSAAEYRYLAPPASSSSREYTTSGQLSLTGLPLVTPMARLRRVFQRPAVTSFSPSPLGAHNRSFDGDALKLRMPVTPAVVQPVKR